LAFTILLKQGEVIMVVVNARVIYIDLTDYEIDKECEEVNAAHVLAKAIRWPLPMHQLTLQ
jgi:hypothetical protein